MLFEMYWRKNYGYYVLLSGVHTKRGVHTLLHDTSDVHHNAPSNMAVVTDLFAHYFSAWKFRWSIS